MKPSAVARHRGAEGAQTSEARASDAIAAVAAGEMIVVHRGEGSDAIGAVMVAAADVTAEDLRFMADEAGGWPALMLTSDRCEELGLSLAVSGRWPAHEEPASMLTFNARRATDDDPFDEQARTMRIAIDPRTTSRDIVCPGSVRPFRARPGGVLDRLGFAEAGVDLARLAGRVPGAVLCAIDDDGTFADLDRLREFSRVHRLPLLSIADVRAHVLPQAPLAQAVASADLPTAFGAFSVVGYRSAGTTRHHVALMKGDVRDRDRVLVGVHTRCLTGDVLHGLLCDCAERLRSTLDRIEREGHGILFYFVPPDGLDRAIDARCPSSRHQETDLRDYAFGAQILRDLGVQSIRLVTDDPARLPDLASVGLTVSEHVPVSGHGSAGEPACAG